jgi:multidrug efflux pump
VLKLPVVAGNGVSVVLGDLAEVRPTFKDATSITRIDGRPAIAIEITKRTGANLIETVDAVKAVAMRLQSQWPQTVQLTFSQDKSKTIRDMLHELQNSVITAVLLVFVIMLVVLGGRASLFIGIAIPASFLTGILGLQVAGLTVNIVVLFALILAVGMLVDDAIIVSEFAERRMAEGMPAGAAYALAAKRMAGPVIAATLTRIAAFSPLMFWPGIVGQFMKYLPLTLIATLSASLVVALFFTPTLGALLGRAPETPHDERASDDGLYMRIVRLCLLRPGQTLVATLALLVLVVVSYGRFGNGVEFFPNVEPDYAIAQIHARGNLSLTEKDAFVRQVEAHILARDDVRTVYARAGEGQKGSAEISEDTIGTIQFEFVDWQQRKPAHVIMDEIREASSVIPGILVEVTAPKGGPPTGKAIQVQLTALDPAALPEAARRTAALIAARDDITDLDDGLPLPGLDWEISVDKAEAAKYGISASQIGTAVQLVTNGAKLTDFRPEGTDKAVDIIVRFPENKRTLDELDELRITGPLGAVPMGNFVQRVAVQRVGQINRVAGQRVITVSANVKAGVQSAQVQKEVIEALSSTDLGRGVSLRMKGEDEERAKAGAFLMKAFGSAIFLIFAILLAQFNRFTSVFLVMSAVVMSTIGVLIGLMVMGQSFGVVMTGIGIIANAGVIVNNNIVLIDTYDRLKQEGWATYEAIIETCRERARPVALTAITAVLGVLAIAFGINLDFVNRTIMIGAPSTQWWVHLSVAIVFGLGFATLLTLIVTPAALLALDRFSQWRGRIKGRLFKQA